MAEYKRFKLSDAFIKQYETKKPPFGFNGLGELTYMRTYSRLKEDGTNERWHETIRRVVEGCYNIQKKWIKENGLHWDNAKAQKSAQEMYNRIFTMKFLPPGRGLWAMGSPVIEEKNLYAALNNCGFVSTKNLDVDLTKPFEFLMDMSMLGVGVGFDTKGAGKIVIQKPDGSHLWEIPDTRGGWVESVRLVLSAYFVGESLPRFDYDFIRKEGEPIKGFGGVASGPQPLKELHEKLIEILEANVGKPISTTVIVDIMNLIGKAVVAGNVRRTAEIVFGDPDSEEYLDLKNYQKNPQRETFGWTSNNSVFAKIGMDYTAIAERMKINGEPGIAWLDNMKHYSRMVENPDWKDWRVEGGNPCLEQSLEPYELCCLVETFPANHDSPEDYYRTLKFAYLYGKTVTLGKTHWAETNAVMLRNRRIGTSMSGIAQFLHKFGINELLEWCEVGYEEICRYDDVYSEWFAIPKSIKKTSIKPSGTVSLVAGATPGVHFPESRFYIRRMRLSKHSHLLPALIEAGYNIEPTFGSEESTVVVEIPVDVGEGIRTLDEVTMWEQLSIAAFMQKYWADNQVSCTVTFDREKEGDQIANALTYFQYQLKGISFLPRDKKAYRQMPYEAITEEKYNEMNSKLKPLNFGTVEGEVAEGEKYCANDVCEIKF
jgi:ribonucleoside-triphosphate reductase